eukprot:scaffold2188_cov388-Prasinococcus_capsulatus_cf.AAC.5
MDPPRPRRQKGRTSAAANQRVPLAFWTPLEGPLGHLYEAAPTPREIYPEGGGQSRGGPRGQWEEDKGESDLIYIPAIG